MSWTTLCHDVRLLILNQLLADAGDSKRPKRRRTQLPHYATVSREWQMVVEKKTFRRLVLDGRHLPKFAEFVAGEKSYRLGFLRYLWLRLKLDKYDCPQCQIREDEETIERNNQVFSQGIFQLFAILARANDLAATRGMTVELSAQSPSDLTHVYRDYRLKDNYPFISDEDVVSKEDFDLYHTEKFKLLQKTKDGRHNMYVNGRRTRAMTPDELLRLRGTRPLALTLPRDADGSSGEGFSRYLPRVDLVKCLKIRRKQLRNIAPASLAELMRHSLRNLVLFRHEQNADVNLEYQMAFLRDYGTVLLPSLPPTLRCLILYQETWSHFAYEHLTTADTPLTETNMAMVRASRSLSHLSVKSVTTGATFMYCFSAIQKEHADQAQPNGLGDDAPGATSLWQAPPLWPEMERLSLLTRELQPHYGRAAINRALQLAAVGASCMPQLRMMELWSRSLDSAAIFRYNRCYNGFPTITWQSNWMLTCGYDLQLDKATIAAWQRVAKTHSHRDLVIERQPLWLGRREMSRTNGTAVLSRLWLLPLVLDSISFRQLQLEVQNSPRMML